MTKLISELKNIMKLSGTLLVVEADKKLLGTYMVLNGKVEYVVGFVYDSNKVIIEATTDTTKYISVDTLVPFLPDCGLYNLPSGLLYLYKIPKKQWHKSLTTEYYKWVYLTKYRNLPSKLQFFNDIYNSKKQYISVDNSGSIWYMDKLVGCIENSTTLVCQDENFKQELIDWNNNNGSYI